MCFCLHWHPSRILRSWRSPWKITLKFFFLEIPFVKHSGQNAHKTRFSSSIDTYDINQGIVIFFKKHHFDLSLCEIFFFLFGKLSVKIFALKYFVITLLTNPFALFLSSVFRFTYLKFWTVALSCSSPHNFPITFYLNVIIILQPLRSPLYGWKAIFSSREKFTLSPAAGYKWRSYHFPYAESSASKKNDLSIQSKQNEKKNRNN